MIYQSKVQMANPIGSSTTCLTEMLIIRKCWQKKYDAYCFGIAKKSCRYYQITKIIFSGSRWDRTGRTGVLLLDVFDLEHPKRIQGSLLRGRPGRNIQNIPKHPNTPQNIRIHPKTSEYTPKHPRTWKAINITTGPFNIIMDFWKDLLITKRYWHQSCSSKNPIKKKLGLWNIFRLSVRIWPC